MEQVLYTRRAGRIQVNFIQFQELADRVEALEKEIKILKTAKPITAKLETKPKEVKKDVKA